MAQTHDGAIKTAAKHLGITAEQYEAQVAAGQKWCSGCREWQPRSAFAADRSRSDGLVASCRSFKSDSARERYVPRPRPQRGRSFVPARDGDRKQARRRVNFFVETGLLPSPNDLPCADCGHLWVAGGRRHEYDHHLGYAAEHHEHVESVCSTCHHERERRRRHADNDRVDKRR